MITKLAAKYYAGIGARETPEEVLKIFETVAEFLARKGYVLRSGHAEGADKAFETGCDRAGGAKEIYLPWKGFNGSDSEFILSDRRAYEIACKAHNNWYNLKEGAKKLHARNSHQLFGADLQTPSEFAICWTKGGVMRGGTAQAIRLCEQHGMPVCNVGASESVDKIKEQINEFLKTALYGESS